jgi:glycosyltransferase involved in cell wall biosynthesis
MSDILIVQQIIPSYRRRVFEVLSQHVDPKIAVISGDRPYAGVGALFGEELRGVRTVVAQVRDLRILGLNFSWQPDALRIVRSAKDSYVVVHGGIYDLTSWALLLWGRLTGRPVIAWTIGLQEPERGLKLRLRTLFYGLARGLLLYGDYPRRLLVEAGFDQSRMHVIYNSLDVAAQREAERAARQEDLAPLRAKFGLGKDAKVLVFIGRLVARKRLPIAIEALAHLAQDGLDAHLLLIGDGDDRGRLETLAKKQGMAQRVHFAGAIYDENEIARLMCICHAAVVPEAGLPIIHPMGYGLPPIISDDIKRHGTEWEAVTEGETGLFYRDGDVKSLAAAIKRCLSDEALRGRMARACRARVEERYTAEGHARRILEGVLKFCGTK